MNNGGLAFPRTGFYPETRPNGERLDIDDLRERLNTVTAPEDGMTYLDWLIGQALKGILSNPHWNAFSLSAAGINELEAVQTAGKLACVYAIETLRARDGL